MAPGVGGRGPLQRQRAELGVGGGVWCMPRWFTSTVLFPNLLGVSHNKGTRKPRQNLPAARVVP